MQLHKYLIGMRPYLILAALAAVTTASKVTYDNYKVFKIFLKSENEAKDLRQLLESNEEYHVWSDHSMAQQMVMVSPKHVVEFLTDISALKLKFEKIIDNVQILVDRQVANRKDGHNTFDWTKYQNLGEIHDWLDGLPKKYPKTVEKIIAGRSYEGRSMKGVKISFRKNNPGVFIEAGIHADEWISSATATYLINEFLTSQDPSVRKFAESYDWYVVPVVNVDGYAYTFNGDRFWRKNRAPTSSNCTGVDLNRNWDYMWMKAGASVDPCSQHYAGKNPFSEVETKTLSDYIRSIGEKLFAYIDFHSAAQLLLIPYGHTPEHLENYNETYAIGSKAMKALAQRYGTEYKVGNPIEVLYAASGLSFDWAKATFKLPIVYCYELRGDSEMGGLLPPEQIIPNAQEVLDSMVVLFEEAKKYGYPKFQR